MALYFVLLILKIIVSVYCFRIGHLIPISLEGGCDKLGTGAHLKTKFATNGTSLGTLNVGTLHAYGKAEMMHELKRYRFEIIGQADGRWLGFGETSTDEGTVHGSLVKSVYTATELLSSLGRR